MSTNRQFTPPEDALFQFALVERRDRPYLIGAVSEACVASAGFLRIHLVDAYGEFHKILLLAISEVVSITPVKREQALMWSGKLLSNTPVEQILQAVSEHYQVSVDQIKARQRGKIVDEARRVFIFLACELSGLTQEQIAEMMGGRDHSVVSHNAVRCRDEMGIYPEIRGVVQAIHYRLQGRFLDEKQ